MSIAEDCATHAYGCSGAGKPDGVEDGVGLDIWPCSLFLCRFLTTNKHLISSARPMLELGAGVSF